MGRELPECVVHKLRLLATMFDDRMGAYALLEKTVDFYFSTDGRLVMALRSLPKGREAYEFDIIFKNQAKLFLLRRKKACRTFCPF